MERGSQNNEGLFRRFQKALRKVQGIPDYGSQGAVGNPQGSVSHREIRQMSPEIKPMEAGERKECEVLCGLTPERKELEEGVVMYSFSGKELTERGAVAGSVHSARLALPWGGEMYMFSRLSPGHEAQDAMSVVVDTKHIMVLYGRLDGVTNIGVDGDGRHIKNDSALLADLLSKGIERILPEQIADENGGVDGGRWRSRMEQIIGARMQQFKRDFRGQGAVTGEFGMITGRKDEMGRFVWDRDMLRVGATEKVSHQMDGSVQYGTGDFGGHEMFGSVGMPSWEMWNRDRERSFIRVTDGESTRFRSHYQRRSFVRSTDDILSVTHTDGLKAIDSRGGLKRVGQYLLDSIEKARRKISDWQVMLENKQMVSRIDDVSAMVIKFKGKKQS